MINNLFQNLKLTPQQNRQLRDYEILQTQKLEKKQSKPQKSALLIDRIEAIIKYVNERLGHLQDEFIIIDNKKDLQEYLNCQTIAIDTETTGLDPIRDRLVGVCLYTKGKKPAYVPVSHIDYVTREKLPNQISIEDLADCLKKLKANVIMHNAPFDIRVLLHATGVKLKCAFDTSAASRLIDENEQHNLKYLNSKYCHNGEAENDSFSSLFKDISFDLIPPFVAKLYAAKDALMTYELAAAQQNILKTEPSVMNVFRTIESPIIDVLVDIEEQGMMIDEDYTNNYLRPKYTQILEEAKEKCFDIIHQYNLQSYLLKHPNSALHGDINLNSTQQIAEILYDLMKIEAEDRSTDAKRLASLDNDFTKALIAYRKAAKLLDAFIIKLPAARYDDGKVRTRMNSMGAKTGRMSSSGGVNLQQIPARNDEIRPMFMADVLYDVKREVTKEYEVKTSKGWEFIDKQTEVAYTKHGDVFRLNQPTETRLRHVMMSADYSSQEVVLMATLCNDEKMVNVFKRGHDLYSDIASIVYKLPYDDCKEFFPKDTPIKTDEHGKYVKCEFGEHKKLANGITDTNYAGKLRRTACKSILLGLLYGRQSKSVAEQIGDTVEVAEKLLQSVFDAYPAIKEFTQSSLEKARKYGYVETLWGRRRHLPDVNLPDYTVKRTELTDPLVTDFDLEKMEAKFSKALKIENYYKRKAAINECYEECKRRNLTATSNFMFKSKAERQVINSIVQGSASDMTKKALLAIHDDKELNDLGARILIPVHDEVIIQSPIRNAKRVRELFKHDMEYAAADKLGVGLIKCDVTVSEKWGGDEVDEFENYE